MRKIYLLDEVNEAMYEQFTAQLDELLAANGTKPVHIELFSQGGSAYVGLAIAGRIHTCSAPIHVKAYGAVMSAATIIFAACDYRTADEATWFMFHDSEEKAKGTAGQLRSKAYQGDAEERQWAELLEAHTGTNSGVWRTLSQQSAYISAAEAKTHGLVDQILKGKKRG